MPYVTLLPNETQKPLAIHYETWGQSVGRAPVLLVHELGGTLESYRAVAELVAHNHWVVAYDQRGAGLSEKPAGPLTLADSRVTFAGLRTPYQCRGPSI